MYRKIYDNFQRLSSQNRISGAVMPILIQSKTMNCNQTLQLRVHTSRLESIKSFIYSIEKRIKTDTYNYFLFTPVLFSSHKGRENNKIYDTYLYQLCLPHKIEKTLMIRQKQNTSQSNLPIKMNNLYSKSMWHGSDVLESNVLTHT